MMTFALWIIAACQVIRLVLSYEADRDDKNIRRQALRTMRENTNMLREVTDATLEAGARRMHRQPTGDRP